MSPFRAHALITALYEIPLAPWGFLTPRFDYTYQTRVFLDPQGLDLISQPDYWLFDLRLAYLTADSRFEFAIWVNNITDQRYLVDVFDLTRQFETILQVWAEPRMFGATISYRY